MRVRGVDMERGGRRSETEKGKVERAVKGKQRDVRERRQNSERGSMKVERNAPTGEEGGEIKQGGRKRQR